MSDGEERREVQIRGVTYVLQDWPLADGRDWSFRLGKVLLAGTGGIKGMLEVVSRNEWRELCDTCIKYTRVVAGHDSDGEELLPKLADQKEHFRGRLGNLPLLVRAHVEAEFADFFGELQDALRPVGKPEKPASVEEPSAG